jgi:hypothetical protein
MGCLCTVALGPCGFFVACYIGDDDGSLPLAVSVAQRYHDTVEALLGLLCRPYVHVPDPTTRAFYCVSRCSIVFF